jgi:hypothetical protein
VLPIAYTPVPPLAGIWMLHSIQGDERESTQIIPKKKEYADKNREDIY